MIKQLPTSNIFLFNNKFIEINIKLYALFRKIAKLKKKIPDFSLTIFIFPVFQTLWEPCYYMANGCLQLIYLCLIYIPVKFKYIFDLIVIGMVDFES